MLFHLSDFESEQSSSKFNYYLILFLKGVLFFSTLSIVSFFIGFGLHFLIDVFSSLFE